MINYVGSLFVVIFIFFMAAIITIGCQALGMPLWAAFTVGILADSFIVYQIAFG